LPYRITALLKLVVAPTVHRGGLSTTNPRLFPAKGHSPTQEGIGASDEQTEINDGFFVFGFLLGDCVA